MPDTRWDRLKFLVSLTGAIFVFLGTILDLIPDDDDPDDDYPDDEEDE